MNRLVVGMWVFADEVSWFVSCRKGGGKEEFSSRRELDLFFVGMIERVG